MMNDPELDELFTDPAHREVVDLLKASRPAAPPLDPHFRSYLRTRLMTQAQRTLQPRVSRSWFPFTLRTRALAPALAAVAAGFVVVLGVEVYLQNQPRSAVVAVDLTRINNKTNVATAEPIVIPFTGPVDKTAVAETVVIEPATSVKTQWVGQNLVIIPDHPLAPNTTYTVTFKPAPRPTPTPQQVGPITGPTPAPAPTPVVMHFTTVRAPDPTVVPPSFKSSNVSYGYDSRLAGSGTVFSAGWTSTDQLLVTRPAGQPGPGAEQASPSASATASGPRLSQSPTDVWLMSTAGNPIRLVVPGGSFPVAAPSGGVFAAWQVTASNQASLQIWDLQGNLQATVAQVVSVPDRAPIWIGTDRIAYIDGGLLRVVDMHGSQQSVPPTRVLRGSVAGSPISSLLAVESVDGSSIVIDVASLSTSPLPPLATGFAWSGKGDLAFLVQQPTGSDLYIATGGKNARRVASSPAGQVWSDLNWAPDAASIMLASKPTGASSSASRLMLINVDGTWLTPFASQLEYSSPQWSSRGDLVLFTRQDEGGRAFWTATSTPTEADAAEKDALAEVDKFMQARLRGDVGAAQDELDPAGLVAYQGGASSLLSATGTKLDRYYPVSIQQGGFTRNKYLVGVRIFVSRSGVQRSFFEEQLTLLLEDQRYLIHAVTSTATLPLGHGPTVLSVEVVQAPTGDQVRVRFDADLRPETVKADTIQVKDSDGNLVNSTITFDPDNHLATLTLQLKPGSSYQLVVTTGVTDINGVAAAEDYHAPLVISH